jgi:hypothetical protein
MTDPDTVLQQQFQSLYQRLQETSILNIAVDIPALEPTAHAFFDAHVGDADPALAADRFFNYIGDIWLNLIQQRLYDPAELLWHEAVAIARRWESTHPPQLIHKGTPFYLWGGTAILRGNIRKAFLLIHASLAEDRRKHYRQDEDPDTPSLKFVTLDARTDTQFFRDLVKIGTDELEQRLTAYRAASGSSLQFGDLQSRFARKHDMREVVFIFTMSVFESLNLRESFMQVNAGNEFGSQLAANCLFDLCQVVEESIREQNPDKGALLRQAFYLGQQCGWPLTVNELRDVNSQQNNDFEATVRGLLNSTVMALGRSPTSSIERDLWLTYVVRNSAGHDLASKLVLQERFGDIYQSILNTLFTVVDRLYRCR